MTEILTRQEGNCRYITFNRPHRLNAVNEHLYEQTLAALRAAEVDDDTRCVVLSGKGRAFCVGADLKAHGSGQRSTQAQMQYVQLGQDVCALIQQMRIPVIAQVHGYALGGGAEIAVSADFLIMAEDAQIGFPEVAIGTFVTGGVTTRLPQLVGFRKATELLLLGERIDGIQAVQCGLANKSCATKDLASVTQNLVQILSGNAPLSVERIKQALGDYDTRREVFDYEARQLLKIMQTSDWQEGVAAFSEKRQPNFRRC